MGPHPEHRRLFKDRTEAGRRLGGCLLDYRNTNPLVLALPRGGVPVGLEVSRVLGAPLDVFIVRKLGAPDQPELGIGAVAQGGTRLLNQYLLDRLGVSEAYLERVTRWEREEVERRSRLLRGDRSAPQTRGRTVILVDDGLATGATARAAIAAIRESEPRRLVLAVPVCAARTAEALRPEVDELVSLETPADLQAIGLWYEDFEQVPDAEVLVFLETARREHARRSPVE